MATKNFKGFQLVALANFKEAESDKNTLYFVRTNEAKSDGFLYFNGKKYGTAKDVETALTKKYGDLKIAAEGGQKDATIAEYVAAEIAKVNTAAGELGKKVTANTEAIARINGTGDGSISKAVSDAKTELIGNDATAGTIKHAEKLATDASKKVDTEIGKLDVTGNTSEAVKGVTVTVDETDGKVIKPVVSIADGTLTGAATDANLVTGTVVKKYVDDKVSDINTSANALGERVGTLETKVGSEAAGEEAATGLFKKIADEASTARAAEKKNADAIAAETTRATAAEEKVKTDLLGGATDDYNTLGKLETKIKAAQSAADKVSGVKSGDKVISLGADGKLSSTISLSIDATAGNDGKKYIHLNGIGGADLGKIDIADFVRDGMLDGSALYTATAATGTVTINTKKYDLTGLTANHAYIVLVWNTDAKKDAMAIDVTSLIDTYTAKDDGGLKLEDHAFSVDTTKIATVESVNGVTSRVSTLEGKVGSAAVEGGAAATGLYKDIADNKAAIDRLNGADTVEGSVDKKIKDALKAGAVTLEVKDNDAYLGVTSATTEGKGTVYTLASKEAAINEAIKKAADAVKVSVINGTYVKGSVDAAGRAITLSETVQEVATSSGTAKGLAEASDVKAYVDRMVSDKNVAAEGESGDTALVSARASGNTVIVATTQKLQNAVAKAESSVQSVNSKTGSTVTLTGADIATNQNVSGNENATVNAVLADIYSKIGAVKVSSQEKTITVDNTGRIIDVHRQTVTAAQEAGHVALECGDDGALYGVMYYSGDDAE